MVQPKKRRGAQPAPQNALKSLPRDTNRDPLSIVSLANGKRVRMTRPSSFAPLDVVCTIKLSALAYQKSGENCWRGTDVLPASCTTGITQMCQRPQAGKKTCSTSLACSVGQAEQPLRNLDAVLRARMRLQGSVTGKRRGAHRAREGNDRCRSIEDNASPEITLGFHEKYAPDGVRPPLWVAHHDLRPGPKRITRVREAAA